MEQAAENSRKYDRDNNLTAEGVVTSSGEAFFNLALERCEELEEMGIRIAREAKHLRCLIEMCNQIIGQTRLGN